MILELAGSRILAPYMGTSIFVWTSLIGIILGSLSAGYWWGGKIADSKPNFKTFSRILTLAALATGLIVIIKEPVLTYLSTISDVRIGGILAALILFSPASALLGMVSPFAAKLKIENVSTSGATIGQLYATSTLGSIFGTFLAGFYLISAVGNSNIIVILAITLLVLASIAHPKEYKLKALLFLFISAQFLSIRMESQVKANAGIIDLDTKYTRVQISKTQYKEKPSIFLITNPKEVQSGSFLDNPNELAFDYTKYYSLDEYFFPGFKTALMIGGGAYSYPKYFLANYKEKKIDVVEIDPKFTQIAYEYFGLKENSNLSIFHEDGRTYLNATQKKYDVIYMDAFRSFYSIPYHLTTQEAVKNIYGALNDSGVVLINTISSIEGNKGKFLRAEYETYKSVFPYVYILPVTSASNADQVQNIMLVATKTQKYQDTSRINSQTAIFLKNLWRKPVPSDVPILTDDYAPVDQYMMKLM